MSKGLASNWGNMIFGDIVLNKTDYIQGLKEKKLQTKILNTEKHVLIVLVHTTAIDANTGCLWNKSTLMFFLEEDCQMS